MPDLPTGTVTLLFTDIEGSTNLLQRLGGEQYAVVLAEQRDLLRHVFRAFDGHEVDTQGDAFFVAFARATYAVSAAVAAQRALFTHAWPEGVTVQVRMGLHTGEPVLAAEGYVGLDVHHAARIMSAAHGGQVLLSQTIRELVEHTLPEGATLLDLGEHRLKDLQRASHLFQLVIVGLPADFPPLKTLDASPNNLPVQPTAFLGREKEIAAALRLLMHENIRLLTLTGPGGTGKTRLALQMAAEASDHFTHGVFFVDLAPLSDPALVVATIAQMLNISERGGQPLLENLKASLREKQMLLLLDNFEQVVQAAPALADLLAACPKLNILVTSRMALHVRAEQEYAVPPLTLPDLKHLPDLAVFGQYEAVTLFIQRARAVKSDFQVTNSTAPTIAEICVCLDGLPLAIELAAARIKIFSPQALLARLGQRLAILTDGARDAPARQQTLRHTIAWSYQLLDVQEQQLFRRLSIFLGGCTLEAVEAVCAVSGDGDSVRQVVDVVNSLIDKSLVQQSAQEGEETRLTMLETIREYGLEALTADGEREAMQRTHAAYYLALAEKEESELEDVQREEWLKRLEREYNNLRAALEWSMEPSQGEEIGWCREVGLRLAVALREFWILFGRLHEGLSLLERVLARSTETATIWRAKALISAGDLSFVQGNMAKMRLMAEEAMILCQQFGDQEGKSFCLYLLGLFSTNQGGEYAQARSLLEESVALRRVLGTKDRLGWSLWALGSTYRMQGEYTSARACYEEALGLFREIGDGTGVVEMVLLLGGVFFEARWDLAKASELIDEGIILLRELPQSWFHMWLLVLGLNTSAEIALSQNKLDVARSQAEKALAILTEIKKERQGMKGEIAWTFSLIAQVEVRQGNYTRARSRYAEILTLAREGGDKAGLIHYLEQLAEVVTAQGEVVLAAKLWGAAEILHETIGSPLPPAYREGYESTVAAARLRLGKQPFVIAWAEGRTMTLEHVLALAEQIATSIPISVDLPDTSPAKAASFSPAGLTPREVEVLRLVAQGLTDAQVAEQLIISPRTVNTHLTSIYNKLGVDSRTAASRLAVDYRLV